MKPIGFPTACAALTLMVAGCASPAVQIAGISATDRPFGERCYLKNLGTDSEEMSRGFESALTAHGVGIAKTAADADMILSYRCSKISVTYQAPATSFDADPPPALLNRAYGPPSYSPSAGMDAASWSETTGYTLTIWATAGKSAPQPQSDLWRATIKYKASARPWDIAVFEMVDTSYPVLGTNTRGVAERNAPHAR